MALAATVAWEYRTTGNTANGGGFDAASAGTDYSQQDSPQASVTDAACAGSTTLTSASAPFTAAMVGNCVGITSGGTFQGYYAITAFGSTSSVTIDRNGPNASGMTAKVGGAVTINATGFQPLSYGAVAGNKHWVKSGVYSLTVNNLAASTNGSTTRPIVFEGYTTTRGDGGRPTITWVSGATNALLISGNFVIVRHMKLVNTGNGQAALLISGSDNSVEDVIVSDPGIGLSLDISGSNNKVRQCWFKGGSSGSSDIARVGGTGNFLEYNVVQGVTGGGGAGLQLNSGCQTILSNLIWGVVYDGLYYGTGGSGGHIIKNNVIWGNGRDGVRIYSTSGGLQNFSLENNIIGKNVAYDINYTPADISADTTVAEALKSLWRCNFFYTTGTARYHQIAASPDDTALTASPFNGDASGDFSLNNDSGAGNLIRTTPCSIAYADAINTAYIIAGTMGTPPAPATTAAMRSLWRELTGEQDSTVVPDATVDLYIQAGLEALNRRVGYHMTTDTTTVALVDGSEEYTLPGDCVEVAWIEHNGSLIEKTDVDQWRKDNVNWRTSKTGRSGEWAMYANKLILNPRPNAAMVADAATCTVRYVSKPVDFSSYGPAQLNSQDTRIPVYYGVAEFSRSYPDSAFYQQRADYYQQKFETEAATIAKNYQARGVAK